MIAEALFWMFRLLPLVSAGHLHLGILVPIDGSWNVGKAILPIANMAVKAVLKSDLLHGYNLTYSLKNSGCSSYKAAGLASDMANSNPPVNGFIGPGCSAACISAGLLAHYWNKPMISYSCSSSDLEKRSMFSTFARTQPFSRTYSASTPEALKKIMDQYHWKRAAIIAPYGHKGDNIWEPIASSVRTHFVKNNLTVSYYKVELMPRYDTRHQQLRKSILHRAMEKARVIFVLATRHQVTAILLAAKELNMLNGSYVFITLDFYLTTLLVETMQNFKVFSSLSTSEILDCFNGIITLTVKMPSRTQTTHIKRWILNNTNMTDSDISSAALRTAPYLHDAILLYAHAVNKTLRDKMDLNDGRVMFQNMHSRSPLFVGMTGPVMIDGRGNRVPTFVFKNVLVKDSAQPLFELWSNGSVKTVFNVTVTWPGGGTLVPDDNPPCVFVMCPSKDESNSVRNLIIITMSVLAFISISASILYYRKRKYERDLLSKSWIIDYREISPVNLDIRFASKVIRYCHDNTSKSSRLSEMQCPNPLSSNFGRYKNEFVALKRLRKDTLNLSRDMLIEMKQVRDLVHVNLVEYVGMCLNPFHICIVSQYCHRGSLQEILVNDDIKLDWFFRASFANDICMGVQAIHNSPIQAHGNLRSSKCLVDSRWVCKVTDYGLNLIKANQIKDVETGSHAAYAKLYWKAPELLDRLQSNKESGSQAGDAYSFGIILYELLTRDEPYSTTNLSPRDVIARICSRTKPPFRPEISTANTPIVVLMNKCWEDDPHARPSFSEIKSTLKEMSRGK